MFVANINFNEIPEIGFALQRYSLNYKTTYGVNNKKCIEVAYINSGGVKINLYGKEALATEGCVVVLFRHLPITTETVGDKLKNHCTVLAEFADCEFSLVEEDEESEGGLTIPFVSQPCKECEEIGKRLQQIALEKAKSEGSNLSLSVEFLSILKKLHEIYKNKNVKSTAFDVISDKVSAYIEENIQENISLFTLAEHIGKSPNHISYAFKRARGVTIKEYINKQKVNRIKSLMQNENKSFKEAVETVGLCDQSYGYRLFKRWTGITPKEYMSITTINKQK